MTELHFHTTAKTGGGGWRVGGWQSCKDIMNANRRFLIAASLPLCLCAAAYAAALTGYRALSGYMSMQTVLIPLLSVPLYRALLSLCLYGCILSAALLCAIWTAAHLPRPFPHACSAHGYG